MTPTTHPAVRDYLRAVDRALGDLPRARREELVDELREHVDAALAEHPDPTEADVRNLLDRLGTPAEIAAAAAERLGVAPRPKRPVLEIVALLFVTAGSVLVPVVGWLIGIALVYTSRIWRTREKVLATVLFPLGFLPVGFMLFFTGSVQRKCFGTTVHPIGSNTATVVSERCTGGPSALAIGLSVTVLVLSAVGPLVSAAVLGRRLRQVAL
jgi:uncharacterized membrane protein